MRHSGTSLSLLSGNGHAQRPDCSPAAELSPDTLTFLADSLKDQWKCYRKLLRKCQRKISKRSTHDLRVYARRLLSLLDLLAPFLSAARLKKAQGVLKGHLDTFDDLRDLQVQRPAARSFRERFPAARCFARFLQKRAGQVSRATRKKARRLRSKPLGKLIRGARAEAKAWARRQGSRPASPLLLGTIDRAFALTRRRKERIAPGDAHSIHCTRVAFKRFRYVIECLKDRLSWADATFLANLHRYQTLMGDIQDAEVLLRAYRKFMRQRRPDLHDSVNFEHALLERRQRLIRKYLAQAGQLFEFWPPAPGSKGVQRQLCAAHHHHPATRARRASCRKTKSSKKAL